MKYTTARTILSVFFLFISGLASSRATFTGKDKIIFKTKNGASILVEKGIIFCNKKALYKYDEDGIVYTSKYNRLIEDSSAILLFLVVDGSPNLDMMDAFRITPVKAIKLATSMASEIKDLDNDGYLEFGGRDLTEVYPSKDSMYYIPTEYFEIKNGRIHPDSSLTKQKDIALNGIYLKHPLDKDGSCCKVIPKPKKQR